MDDLVQFLRARYDEETALAQRADAVDPSPWRADVSNGRPSRDQDRHKTGEFWEGQAGMVVDRDGNDLWDCEGSSALSMTSESAQHTARHHPARVLAEVDAKRQALAHYERIQQHTRRSDGGNDYLFAEGAVRRQIQYMALPYRDDPGYRPEWAPDQA
jgi:hypothetical protein